MQRAILLVALASVGASKYTSLSTITSGYTVTVACTGAHPPNDCELNGLTNTIITASFPSGRVITYVHEHDYSSETDSSSLTSSTTGNLLSTLPTLSGLPRISGLSRPRTTTVTASTVFTFECTATLLPEGCKVNNWSNTVLEVTATSGQTLVNLPTDIIATGAAPTAGESTKPTATPGAALGRDVGVFGAVVGGLVAGLAVL